MSEGMSDELIRLPGAIEHGCGKNAGWGLAKPRHPSHWFCFEHRAEGERFL